MGVSSTHIDWTMVPYIRKSFEKHYMYELIKKQSDFMELDLFTIDYDSLKKWVSKHIADLFVEKNYSDDDFKFANKDKFDKELYQSALLNTRNEIYQAVEGMYHNLNTLQSRSGKMVGCHLAS